MISQNEIKYSVDNSATIYGEIKRSLGSSSTWVFIPWYANKEIPYALLVEVVNKLQELNGK